MVIKELKNVAQTRKKIKSHSEEGFYQVFACVEMRVSWFSRLSFHQIGTCHRQAEYLIITKEREKVELKLAQHTLGDLTANY